MNNDISGVQMDSVSNPASHGPTQGNPFANHDDVHASLLDSPRQEDAAEYEEPTSPGFRQATATNLTTTSER